MTVLLDTNACIAYFMDFSVRPRGSGLSVGVRGRNRDAIADTVDRAIKSAIL